MEQNSKKYQILISNVKKVPIDCLRDVNTIRKELTFINPKFLLAQEKGYSTYNIQKYIVMYTIYPGYICVPRYYSIQDHLEYGITTNDIDIVVNIPKPPIHVNVKIPKKTGYEYQEAAIQAAIDDNDGVIIAPPGSGKTVMGLKMFNNRMTRTLILTPTTAIQNQWYKLFKESTDAKILKFSNTKPKKGKEPIDVRNYDVVISTVQGLFRTPLTSNIYNEFGLIILDELHMFGAPKFNEVMLRFNGERFGLTATPARNDGMSIMFEYHLGNVVAKLNYKQTNQMAPIIYTVDTKFDYICSGANLSKYYSELWACEEFTDEIVDYILNLSKDRFKTLVLTNRVYGVTTLYNKLKDKFKGKIRFIIGNSPMPDDRNYDLLIACWQKIKLGYNDEELDTLIIVADVGTPEFAEQTVGRVLRKSPLKEQPIVYDITLPTGPMMHVRYKRIRAWKNLGWLSTPLEEKQ